MPEIEKIPFVIRKRHALTSVIFAVLCALPVWIFRLPNVGTIVTVGQYTFSFTDIFMILAGGIGGFSTGVLSFTFLFATEFCMRLNDFSSLYTMSTYLILVLTASLLSYRRCYASWWKSILASFLLVFTLVLCWTCTFIWFPSGDTPYEGLTFSALLVNSVPECIISVIIQILNFRFAPDDFKDRLGSGWRYTKKFESFRKKGKGRRAVLARRVLAACLVSAMVLSMMMIVFSAVQQSTKVHQPFNFWWIFNGYNFQLAMLSLCVGVPVAALFNFVAHKIAVEPLNAMSFLMERYFDDSNGERFSSLPDLGIHSGDEIEKLYLSLQKMVGDMEEKTAQIICQQEKLNLRIQELAQTLTNAIDAKDSYTNGHSLRVAQYSREIAKRHGMKDEEQDMVYLIALLHDVGKIGIPDTIINKPARLTDEEFAIIKGHPAKGAEILSAISDIPEIAYGAHWHHERWDGHGYPDGLKEDQIPQIAQIISVADAYDAMTSNRSYREVMPQKKVRSEIEKGRGSQFAPVFADIMLQMISDDKNYDMRGNK